MALRGSNWNNGVQAGVWNLNLNNEWSNSNVNNGGRAARNKAFIGRSRSLLCLTSPKVPRRFHPACMSNLRRTH